MGQSVWRDGGENEALGSVHTHQVHCVLIPSCTCPRRPSKKAVINLSHMVWPHRTHKARQTWLLSCTL